LLLIGPAWPSWPHGSASPDGPPPRHTGGFGEPTCEACHSGGAEPGTPAGAAQIIGLPETFEPGRPYEITIAVRRPALERAGFQLAVRFASGEPLAALQAGALKSLDTTRVALDRDSTMARTVVYARHTRLGTVAGRPGEARWMVRWTAPAERQAVVFHAAVVAANDDNSSFGDEVCARAQLVPPARR